MKHVTLQNPTTRAELKQLAAELFPDLVKAVVDIENEIMVVNAELHADEEAILLQEGSLQKNLWGINIYPYLEESEWIEFDSMINLRPSQGNITRGVDDLKIQEQIRKIVKKLVTK